MSEFKNRAIAKVLDESYNILDGILTIKIKIPEQEETTGYFKEKLETKHNIAFIAPIGQADENNRSYISDYVNLHIDGCPFGYPQYKVKKPVMIILAVSKDEDALIMEDPKIFTG